MFRALNSRIRRQLFLLLSLCAVSVLFNTVFAQAAFDDFGSVVYDGGSGNIGWATDWVETGDNNSATNGQIRILNGELRLNNNGTTQRYVSRQVDLSDQFTALLIFDVRSQNVDASGGGLDQLSVQLSDDGGSNWTEVELYSGEITQNNIIVDLTSYLSSTTTIRFGGIGLTSGNEYYYIDDVQIFVPVISFETDEPVGGTPLVRGDGINGSDLAGLGSAVGDQPYIDDGITITVDPNSDVHGPGMIFDTENATDAASDPDLATPNETCSPAGLGDGSAGEVGEPGENCDVIGNILIIQETTNGNTTPDDVAGNGSFTFTFDNPVNFYALTYIDDLAGTVTLTYADMTSQTVDDADLLDFPANGENAKHFATYADFGSDQDDIPTNVVSVTVQLAGSSGGIEGLYTSPTGVDFGDAPATFGSVNHFIDPNNTLIIGSDVDSEEESTPSANADSDDNGNSPPTTDQKFDDEDGVSFRAEDGNTVVADIDFVNDTGGPVTICAWLNIPDGSADDSFESGEGQCTTTSAVSGTESISWGGFPSISTTTFVRVRITSNALDSSGFTGSASDGEVEDYALPIDFTPTAVTIGSVNIETVSTNGLLSDLGVEQMTDEELLDLLAVWDPETAADVVAGDDIVDALNGYLDPDDDGRVAMLVWDTLEERGTIGFYVERKTADGSWERINDDMLPGLITAPMGGEYRLVDPAAQAGNRYEYLLIEQEASGVQNTYGPYIIDVD